MPAPTVHGPDNIAWGTSGILGSPVGAIVKTISFKATNKSKPLLDNNGDVRNRVYPQYAFEATLTCQNDTSKTWPKAGDSVNLTYNSVTYPCHCESPDLTANQDKEQEIQMVLTYDPECVG